LKARKQYSKADFEGPITCQFFKTPVEAVPCGHIFEKDKIIEWTERDLSCPCCREIVNFVKSPSEQFLVEYNNFLAKNPGIAGDIYSAEKDQTEKKEGSLNKLNKCCIL